GTEVVKTRTVRFAVLALALVAPAAIAQAPDPKTLLDIHASLAPAAAGKGTLTLRANLASGWHVTSHKPSEEYLIPTEVKLDPADSVSFGEPRYPEGKSLKFAFSDTPLSVYAEEFAIDVPVEWTGASAPKIQGSVAFQACSDQQCLAP